MQRTTKLYRLPEVGPAGSRAQELLLSGQRERHKCPGRGQVLCLETQSLFHVVNDSVKQLCFI